MMLTIESYNAAERSGRRGLSNDHLRAFSPITFLIHGYPVAVDEEDEIVRYSDTMQELNDPIRLHEVENYSSFEAGLVRAVSDCALSVTEQLSGRRIRPWMGPLAAIPLVRVVEAVARATDRSALRVFEIGPGSGYLGAMLAAAGHRYIGMDNCQGFYLWQNRLLGVVAERGFFEGALQPEWTDAGTANVAHMPWWQFAALHGRTPPAADILLCDHALGEMHPYALRYVCQMARDMLEQSDLGYIAFTSIGAPQFHSEEAIRLNFARVGFERVLHGKITMFALASHGIPEALKDLAHVVPIAGEDGSRIKGRDFVPICREEAPPSYAFYEYMGFDIPRPTP